MAEFWADGGRGRRRLLKAAGSVGLTAVAGCLDGGGSTATEPQGTPSATGTDPGTATGTEPGTDEPTDTPDQLPREITDPVGLDEVYTPDKWAPEDAGSTVEPHVDEAENLDDRGNQLQHVGVHAAAAYDGNTLNDQVNAAIKGVSELDWVELGENAMATQTTASAGGGTGPLLEVVYQTEDGDWNHMGMIPRGDATAEHPDRYTIHDLPDSDFHDGNLVSMVFSDLDSIMHVIEEVGGRDEYQERVQENPSHIHAINNIVIGPNDTYNVDGFNGDEIPVMPNKQWLQDLDDRIDEGDPEASKELMEELTKYALSIQEGYALEARGEDGTAYFEVTMDRYNQKAPVGHWD
jgi:hypothetical protein